MQQERRQVHMECTGCNLLEVVVKNTDLCRLATVSVCHIFDLTKVSVSHCRIGMTLLDVPVF